MGKLVAFTGGRVTTRTHIGGALALGALLAPVAGCLYTEPLNERPVARIARYEGEGCKGAPFVAGDTVCFEATKSTDDDRETLLADWLVVHCPPGGDDSGCMAREELSAPDSRLDEIFEVPIPAKGELNVQLIVVDELGARSIQDVEVIDVQNQVPNVALQAQKPWVVGTPISVFAEVGDPDEEDQGAVELSWTYYAPDGSRPDDVVFEEAGELSYRLTPDVVGLWQVELTATDADGGEGVADVPIAVEVDGAPCIELTDPAAVKSADAGEVESSVFVVDRDGGARRFAVLTVDDVLDPYPGFSDPEGVGGEASFSWEMASPDSAGALVPLAGHEASDYILDPSGFAPGDRITLRVEAHDRTPRALCPAEEPTCAVNTEEPGCFQRLTWEVEIR